MKKPVYFIISIVIIVLSAVLAISSTLRCFDLSCTLSNDVEALAFSNEGPGPQGQRHKQSVWCSGSGWVIRVGCCYGAENCSVIECGENNHNYSCNGNDWIVF